MKSSAFIHNLLWGFINHMLGTPKDWTVKPASLVQQWSGRQGLNPKCWKHVSGSYKAILGKRMRKFYNTSLFYKISLGHATFLTSNKKPTEKNLNYLQMYMSNSLLPISTKPVHVLLRAVFMNMLPDLDAVRFTCWMKFYLLVESEDEHLLSWKQQLFCNHMNNFSQDAFWIIRRNLGSSTSPVFYYETCIYCNL